MSSAGQPALPEVVRFLEGTHCTVLGSAPQRVLPYGYEGTVVVCANGAGLGLSRSADLTVLGAGVCRGSDRTSRHTLRNMNGRRSERVLFVHPGTLEDYPERFNDFGFSWGTHGVMTAEERARFVLELTGYSSGGLTGPFAISNGVLALLLAAAAGARRIDSAGFSLSAGHYYISGHATPRNHASHDAQVLSWLADNAPIFSSDDEMKGRFGFAAVEEQ